MGVKRGNPVEFTREWTNHHTIGEGEFGIAIEDARADKTVMVELANGSRYLAKYIHAYAWTGWVPDELEELYEKYNADNDFDDDY